MADFAVVAAVADLAAVDDAPTVSGWLPAVDFAAVADLADEPEPAELDTWALVLEIFAPARIARSPGSFGPYAAVTSTPAFSTSTWNSWVVSVVSAGSAVPCDRAASPPPTTMASDDGLAELTGWMSSASVWPMADAGQLWPLPGVPR